MFPTRGETMEILVCSNSDCRLPIMPWDYSEYIFDAQELLWRVVCLSCVAEMSENDIEAKRSIMPQEQPQAA